MKQLSIDIESFSSVDLTKCGVYRYAESPDFAILLFGYAVDGGDVQVVDLASGESIPADVLAALEDETVTKWAFNANFERVCLSRYLGLPTGDYLDPASWRCSMVWSAYMGLPQSLEGVGTVLGLEKQKLTEGKDLIRYFCVPCKPTKANGGRTRNLPEHNREKWARFKAYNLRDVEAEMQIQQKLSKFPVPDAVWEEYWLDQEINDRGIGVDMEMVAQAIAIDARAKAELTATMIELTGLENPNSVMQMKQWLSENGLAMDSLGKKEVSAALRTAPEPLRTVLTLRQQLAKSSVKKYQAMENAVCTDSRAHGMFKFYGANRTGRYSGKIIQLQNLYRNSMPDLAEARELVKSGNFDALSLLYDDIPDTLSQLIRTAFVPQYGKKFIVADFSAIEARVIAWLAKEDWRLDVFASGGDIYCASASQMFGVPVVKHGINGHLRQKGKIAELALGYGGSVGALKSMGALEMGLQEEELQPLVDAWRESNPSITRLWWSVDRAVKDCIKKRLSTETHGIRFEYKSGFLFIILPSGRRLAYVKPRIGENKFGGESVTYMGIGGTKKWERLESYGPKFVENCIAEGSLVITNHGLKPIEAVSNSDLLWDGIEWCQHEGLIKRGVQEVIAVDGLYMTPEHKILTKKGWVESAKSGGLNWETVPLPDGSFPWGEHTAGESAVGMSLCLRKSKNNSRQEPKSQKSCKVVRLYAFETNSSSSDYSRDESSSGVGSVALDEAEMRESKPCSLSQLRSQRHYCLQQMGKQLRELLGGHGENVQRGPGYRQDRQQCRVFSRELPLGDTQSKLPKPEKQSLRSDPTRQDNNCGTCGENRCGCNDATLPFNERLAGGIVVSFPRFQKYVYDIRNCGPRHRFTLWDASAGKARVVSNCVQAISRDILCYAMRTLSPCAIVAHVHDEIIIEADRRMSLKAVCEQMGRTPPWAEGLLLRADGYECEFYQKD